MTTQDGKPVPTLGNIFATFMTTLHESVDSKKSMTGLIGAIASILVLIAGKQGWTWFNEQLSQEIAGVLVVKGLAVIAAHASVDKATAVAAGATDAAFVKATMTPPVPADPAVVVSAAAIVAGTTPAAAVTQKVG